jgi:NitT/TauT family transport system substrate-binding protein
MLRLKRGIRLGLVAGALMAAGCGDPKTPADKDSQATAPTNTGPALTYDQALALVRSRIPSEKYFSNELLPKSGQAAPSFEKREKLRISMPWVFNDELAPWYLAQEKKWFDQVGLDVELVAGGPGIDALQLLVAGQVDIGVPAGASFVLHLRNSRTGSDVVAIAAIQKNAPISWIGLDSSIPKNQRSTFKPTLKDLIGKRVGMQPGNDFYLEFALKKAGYRKDAVKFMQAGFTPDPLLAGVMDYYFGWVNNQPRLIEQAGYSNWFALRSFEAGVDEYCDVSVVRRETFEKRGDLLRRYLWALNQGAAFIVEHPEEAAEVTARRSTDVTLTPAQVMRRFDLQKDLMVGNDHQPLLYMSAERWDSLAAGMVQFNQIELPNKK